MLWPARRIGVNCGLVRGRTPAGPAPAQADASATVQGTHSTHVRRQPGLPAERLVQHRRSPDAEVLPPGPGGEGFLQLQHPQRGMDNLWYRTSDGNFVADVDIETGTLNDVAQDCGADSAPAQAPPAASSKAEAAVMKAKQHGWWRPVRATGMRHIRRGGLRRSRDRPEYCRTVLRTNSIARAPIQQGAAPRGALVFSESFLRHR